MYNNHFLLKCTHICTKCCFVHCLLFIFFHKSIPHLSNVGAHLGNSQNYSLSRPSFKSLKTVKFSLNRPCSFQSSWLVHRLSILLRISSLLCLTTLTHLIPRSNVTRSVKTFLTFLLLFQAQLVATFPVTPYHIVYIFASHGLLLTCELQRYELLTCKESVPNT